MSEHDEFTCDRMTTPLGPAILVADGSGALHMFFWEEQAETWCRVFHRTHRGAKLTQRGDRFGHVSALTRYFDGEIAALDGIRVAPSGTPFQRKVWRALRTIDGGTTLSYGGLAQRIDEPRAIRAVGAANARNPVGVVVPCHRVVGSDGTLTGYAGGLVRKRWLLEHEAHHSSFRLERSV